MAAILVAMAMEQIFPAFWVIFCIFWKTFGVFFRILNFHFAENNSHNPDNPTACGLAQGDAGRRRLDTSKLDLRLRSAMIIMSAQNSIYDFWCLLRVEIL